jgi:3-phosphoshikimate 1-carboxyvinyltransferase
MSSFPVKSAFSHPNADILIKNVGVNETRTGLLDALSKMGGNISIENTRIDNCGEPVADIHVQSSALKACKLTPDFYTRMADEYPGFSIAAMNAIGTTHITGVSELARKKSNRLVCLKSELSKFGADIAISDESMTIKGGSNLFGTECISHGDHRLGNTLLTAGLIADGITCVKNIRVIRETSYPGIWSDLVNLCGRDTIVEAGI